MDHPLILGLNKQHMFIIITYKSKQKPLQINLREIKQCRTVQRRLHKAETMTTYYKYCRAMPSSRGINPRYAISLLFHFTSCYYLLLLLPHRYLQEGYQSMEENKGKSCEWWLERAYKTHLLHFQTLHWSKTFGGAFVELLLVSLVVAPKERVEACHCRHSEGDRHWQNQAPFGAFELVSAEKRWLLRTHKLGLSHVPQLHRQASSLHLPSGVEEARSEASSHCSLRISCARSRTSEALLVGSKVQRCTLKGISSSRICRQHMENCRSSMMPFFNFPKNHKDSHKMKSINTTTFPSPLCTLIFFFSFIF